MIFNLRYFALVLVIVRLYSYCIRSAKLIRKDYHIPESSSSDDVFSTKFEVEEANRLMNSITRSVHERRKTEYELHLENQEKIAAELLETAKKLNLSIDEQGDTGNIDLLSISDGRQQEIEYIS